MVRMHVSCWHERIYLRVHLLLCVHVCVCVDVSVYVNIICARLFEFMCACMHVYFMHACCMCTYVCSQVLVICVIGAGRLGLYVCAQCIPACRFSTPCEKAYVKAIRVHVCLYVRMNLCV